MERMRAGSHSFVMLLCVCWLSVTAFWLTPTSAQARADVINAPFANLESNLEALRDAYQAPGMAVAIVKDGRVVYAHGFGFRDVQSALPVTPDTVFPTASVTKQFTAAMIGMHAASGALSIADSPSAHLRELRFNTDKMNNLVTLSDLLSHRSGIGVVDATHVFFPTGDRKQHLARLQHLKPNSEVRERFDYSNMGYAVLGAICERISGQSWESEIERGVFEPLRMSRSSASLEQFEASENRAVGYGMMGGLARKVLNENQNESGPSGAVNSTVMDLTNWMIMLLDDGRFEGKQIVPKEFLATAFSAHAMINPTYDPSTKSLGLDGYGYGWFVSEYEGRYRVNHGGNTSGFSAHIDMLPGENLGVAILTNQSSSQITRYAADIVYRAALGLDRKAIGEYPVQVDEVDAVEPVGPINEQSPPSRQLKEYIGRYSNAGYGQFAIFFRDGALYAEFPAFSFALEHRQSDVFALKRYYEMHQNSPSFPVTFQSDINGNITSASLPLQSQAVVFKRE